MKKNYLSLFLAGMFYFLPKHSNAQETEQIHSIETAISLKKETPVEIVAEVVDKRDIKGRDFLNLISRIDEEEIKDRSKYENMGILEAYSEAINDEIKKDTLFYAWEEYEQGDLIIENQMLTAAWNIGVAKVPGLFGRTEKVAKYAKKKTTWKPSIEGYRFKINPELDNQDYLNLRIKLKKENSFLNDLILKLESGGVKLSKSWNLKKAGKQASICIDAKYNWDEKCTQCRLTLKIPYWFSREVAQIDSVEDSNI